MGRTKRCFTNLFFYIDEIVIRRICSAIGVFCRVVFTGCVCGGGGDGGGVC